MQGTSKLNPTGFSRGAAVGVPRPGETPQNFGMQRCPGPESPSGRVLLLAGAQGPRESTWLAVSFRPKFGFRYYCNDRCTHSPPPSLASPIWLVVPGRCPGKRLGPRAGDSEMQILYLGSALTSDVEVKGAPPPTLPTVVHSCPSAPRPPPGLWSPHKTLARRGSFRGFKQGR